MSALFIYSIPMDFAHLAASVLQRFTLVRGMAWVRECTEVNYSGFPGSYFDCRLANDCALINDRDTVYAL